MSRSLSWIDPDVLGALLQSVGATRGDSLTMPPQLIPVHTAPPPPPPPPKAAAPKIAPAMQVTPVEVLPLGVVTPLTVSRIRLDERLKDLLDWIEEQVHCEQVFVADGDGLPMAENNASSGLLAAASWIASSWERVRDYLNTQDYGILIIELDGDRYLQMFHERTPERGVVNVGIVVPAILNRDTTHRVQEAIRATLRRESS